MGASGSTGSGLDSTLAGSTFGFWSSSEMGWIDREKVDRKEKFRFDLRGLPNWSLKGIVVGLYWYLLKGRKCSGLTWTVTSRPHTSKRGEQGEGKLIAQPTVVSVSSDSGDLRRYLNQS